MDETACCVRCTKSMPVGSFHWQVSVVQGERVRTRDRTCKSCRAYQKRQRDRTRPEPESDGLAARFLRLPVHR